MRPGVSMMLTDVDRERLDAIVRDRNSPRKHVWRARIVLLTAAGLGTNAVMRETGKSKTCVWRWRERFMAEGVGGLVHDKTRPSRIRPLGQAILDRVIALTNTKPPHEATHGTAGAMAEAVGVSASSVQRIWRAHQLRPHRFRSFKLSTDPAFADKVRAIVGLYVDPPAHGVVLSIDEKSQIQALDRTQPSLPMKPGRLGTMTHDYKRHGTTTLFAALNVLTGAVIGQCLPRHRHDEFLVFLRRIQREVPRGLQVHLILDNYATHSHPDVQAWLAKHPRFHLHFTPTSSSWLNLVERWFRNLTDKRLRRGSFNSVADLIAAIEEYLTIHNEDPKPFVWTATADSILAKVRRGRVALKK